MSKEYQRKVMLAVSQRQTKWAPFWAVVKRFGQGKKMHPSQMTARRRHWRRTKLKVGPRRTPNTHLG
jgi:ribosomal protein L39E